jgi:hypothetical protein
VTGRSPSPATAGPPIDEWAALHEAMRRSSWSPEARDAGAWALNTLQRRIGTNWPQRWRRAGEGPPEVLHASTHLIALAAAPGPVALAHSRLLLRLGGLARRAGLDVAFEPRTDGGPPADIRLTGEDASVTVEARVLLRDDVTLAAQRWLDDTSPATLALASRHDVDLDGTLEAPLDDTDTRRLLEELDRAAASVAAGVRATVTVRLATVAVSVGAAKPDGPRQRWKMPAVQLWRRAEGKLRRKVDQSQRSGADWLVVQATDDLLRLTAAAALRPAERVELLTRHVRAALGDAAHLHGAVIDDGAVLVRPVGDDFTGVVGVGAVARGRRLDAIRLRETVTVTLSDRGKRDSSLWARLWDAEPGWTAWAAERCGVTAPPELAA